MSYVVVPPGQSPPFEVVDDQHHGAWIIIATALGVAITLVCWLIRLYVRFVLTSTFGIADWILAASSAMALIQSIIILAAAHYGFGTSIELLKSDIVVRIQNMLVASDVFYIISLYLAKISVMAILLQLTPQRKHNLASWVVGGVCTAWFVVSVLLITVDCEVIDRPGEPAAEHCTSLLPRWRFITALDIITEIAWPALAITVVYGIKTSLNRKIVILSAFCSRLLIIIFTVLRLHYEGPAFKSLDPTLAFIEPYLWAETAMHYSLIACTAFCLRPFMIAVSTNYGTAGDEFLTSSGSRNRTGKISGSYAMKAMSRSSRKKGGGGSMTGNSALRSTTSAVVGERYEGYLSTRAGHGPSVEATRRKTSGHDASSVGSNESTKMIIRKDMDYMVEYLQRQSA
ncbi:conserved hypothetical protein [Talaromyces stipitatus ATCC 10500]|uniref:Rhodopsin domain-containing protein n=1 Tax=Talaromyces stipitatus (strain ATCC 10500 / CBS 375.48 / QM 6759 / NRRL 1006) TaxID=441959 RepID=B8LWA1_TALSN|nr:uncharacterized protein TSTA_075050 [Talaromyces stipitatus ATCC 10500]EED24129.1 conserved hypothetical protein [Talaromyces stipitatus ATCC 10500]